jgi:hypothetical protein
MKFFTIYNQKTGEISNSGTCFNIDIQVVPEGFSIIELQSNPLTQYVKNNLIKNIPQKPNFECDFDFINEVWTPSFDKQSQDIKAQRKILLLQSDWTQIPNGPLTVEQQQAWADYRQQLRDITSQSGYPFNVVWPTSPQG